MGRGTKRDNIESKVAERHTPGQVSQGVREVWGALGITDNDLEIADQLHQAANLVEQNKMSQDVYDKLLETATKQLSHVPKRTNRKTLWGRITSSTKNRFSRRSTQESGPRKSSNSNSRNTIVSRLSRQSSTKLMQEIPSSPSANFENERLARFKKPVMEGLLYIKENESIPTYRKLTLTMKHKSAEKQEWTHRYFVLYKNSLEYYRLTKPLTKKLSQNGNSTLTPYLEKEDPLGVLNLSPDTFVSDKGNETSAGDLLDSDGESDAQSDYTDVVLDQMPMNLKGFILSDMNARFILAAESAELKTYWMHTINVILKKTRKDTNYFDQPILLDRPVRTQTEIQADYENRMKAYAEGKRKQRLETVRRLKQQIQQRHRKSFDGSMGQQLDGMERRKRYSGSFVEDHLRDTSERLRTRSVHSDDGTAEGYYETLNYEEEEYDPELGGIESVVAMWKERAEEAEARVKEEREHADRVIKAAKKQCKQNRQRLIEEKEQLERLIRRRKTIVTDVDDEEMAKMELENKALMAKLDALQSALDVNLDDLDWDGSLEDAEEKMRALVPRLCSEDPNVVLDAEAEFEQWDKIIRNHADYKLREEKKQQDWEDKNKNKNLEALELMKSLIPPEYATGLTIDSLIKKSKKKLSRNAAKRVLKTQILKLLFMDKDTISKIHVADLSSRYIPQGLDLVELRAVYACLPTEFQNDRDGRKQQWLESIRSKLMEMTEKESKGTLPEPQKRAFVYRSKEEVSEMNRALIAQRPTSGVPQNLRAKKKKGMKGKRGKPGPGKIDTSALQAALAGKLADMQGGGPPGGKPPKKGDPLAGLPFGKPPPHVLASRAKMEEASGGSAAPTGAFGKLPPQVLASMKMMEETSNETPSGGDTAAPTGAFGRLPPQVLASMKMMEETSNEAPSGAFGKVPPQVLASRAKLEEENESSNRGKVPNQQLENVKLETEEQKHNIEPQVMIGVIASEQDKVDRKKKLREEELAFANLGKGTNEKLHRESMIGDFEKSFLSELTDGYMNATGVNLAAKSAPQKKKKKGLLSTKKESKTESDVMPEAMQPKRGSIIKSVKGGRKFLSGGNKWGTKPDPSFESDPDNQLDIIKKTIKEKKKQKPRRKSVFEDTAAKKGAKSARKIDKKIEKLILNIRKHGSERDPNEGGHATIIFGDLIELYGSPDKVVGVLLRAKKRKRIFYRGDTLFVGMDDKEKVTVLF